MGTVSALGGQNVSAAGIARQALALGAGVPGLSVPGVDLRFADTRRALVIVPSPMNWLRRSVDASLGERSMGSSFLGGGFSYPTAVAPRIAPEQPSQQLGAGPVAERGGVGALADSSARGEALAHSSARAETATDRLPYASLIRGMLDRDQVASARTLLSVALAEQPSDSELRIVAAVLARPTSVRKALRDRDRVREYAWLTSHGAEHRGQWVAVVGNELVASADSLKQLLLSLEASEHRGDALIHRVA